MANDQYLLDALGNLIFLSFHFSIEFDIKPHFTSKNSNVSKVLNVAIITDLNNITGCNYSLRVQINSVNKEIKKKLI